VGVLVDGLPLERGAFQLGAGEQPAPSVPFRADPNGLSVSLRTGERLLRAEGAPLDTAKPCEPGRRDDPLSPGSGLHRVEQRHVLSPGRRRAGSATPWTATHGSGSGRRPYGRTTPKIDCAETSSSRDSSCAVLPDRTSPIVRRDTRADRVCATSASWTPSCTISGVHETGATPGVSVAPSAGLCRPYWR
jgi:hypothetical protein